MLPEVKQIEAQLKQILYGCVEHVQATKAALYLAVSPDLNDKRYELVTSYQYNPADRKVVTANDDLVDRLTVRRSPFYVNGLAADQRFAEMMFRQGNDRLLATPLFSRGRLVGFIDMRDKAGKKPFETQDVQAASTIADQMIGVLAANKLFGLGPISLVEDPSVPARAAASPMTIAAPPQKDPAGATAPSGQVFSEKATRAIEAARQYIARRQHAPQQSARLLSESDLDGLRVILPAALAIPGSTLACFTAIGHPNNPQIIVASAQVTDAALEQLQAHLEAWLKRTNQLRLLLRPQLLYPFGKRPAPIESLGRTFSAPINVPTVDGLVLTVAFSAQPEATAQRALTMFLRQLERSIDAAIASNRNDRQSLADMLLEPDFQKFPELAEHSREVAAVAQRFAKVLELSQVQSETVRLAALVHDVGLRLLDYERLYKRLNLTAEELRGLAEHPVIGAALVEPLLGSDVAQAVLRHHERVDGRGYPSRMSGQQIPLAARIVQIADAWVAMTSRHTYQVPVGRDEAIKRLREGAGTQFDAPLVERFVNGIAEISA